MFPASAAATAGRARAAVLFSFALAACTSGDGASDTAKSGSPPVPVLVAKVERLSAPVTASAIGNVEAIDSVAVKSRIDGQIVAVHVGDGQPVRKGQLLFVLDPRYLEAQLRQLEAARKRDQALLYKARSTEQRYADLLARKFISEEAYTQAKADSEAAQAAVAADAAAVESARVQLSYTHIYASLNGRAGRVMLPPGNTVKANETTLVVINQIAPIYVSFSLPERYLAEVRRSGDRQPLAVDVKPQQAEAPPSTGKLAFIDNAVDMQTGTIKLRAEFANRDRRLWPGQFVSVTLTLHEQADAVAIPPAAVQNGPKGQYVFVIKPDMTAEMRSIVIDRTEGEHAIVAKGLQVGETIVTNGQLRLVPGAKVSPKVADARA